MSEQNKIYLASSIDDDYAMPFAAMVASVFATLSPEYSVEFFVMDGGVSALNKERIRASFAGNKIKFNWLAPHKEEFENIFPTEHISLAAYYKASIFTQLPREVTRVIFLDADLIVLKDLSLLWRVPTQGKILSAVQDLSIPYIDASQAMPNFNRCKNYLEAAVAIKDYQEDGLNPCAPYFNTGVMLVDVTQWKSAGIETKIVNYLTRNHAKNKYFDQDGFNAVLSEKWTSLDPRWNQISHLYRYPSFAESPLDQTAFLNTKNDPYIVHFVSVDKPWHFGNRHPKKEIFLKFVSPTAWSDWRPNFRDTLRTRAIFLSRNIKTLCQRRAQQKSRVPFLFYPLCCVDICRFFISRLSLCLKQMVR
jgi:lipopolysaccharide biosynthesis glycosyltransferase